MNPSNVTIFDVIRFVQSYMTLDVKKFTRRPGATHDDPTLLRTQADPTPAKILITTAHFSPASVANTRTLAVFDAEGEWMEFVPRIGNDGAHIEKISLGDPSAVHHVEVPLEASSSDATSFISIAALCGEAADAYEMKRAGLTRYDAGQLLRDFLRELREVGLYIEDTESIVKRFDLL